MNIGGHEIGVCNWSLQPANMADLVAQMRTLTLSHVQVAFLPLLQMDEPKREQELDQLRDAGITITAGMMSFPGEDYATIAIIHDTGGYLPDKLWEERRDLTKAGGKLAEQLGIRLLSVHVGFIPMSSDPRYRVLIERVRELAAGMAEARVDLLMETGQERAAELLQFLNDVSAKNVHVNFDPANMILYGAGDPIEAVKILGRHIRHVHVKDAVLSRQPGVLWGEEVPFGSGQVGPARFLEALKGVGYGGPLAVEREAGSARLADVGTAIESLRNTVG